MHWPGAHVSLFQQTANHMAIVCVGSPFSPPTTPTHTDKHAECSSQLGYFASKSIFSRVFIHCILVIPMCSPWEKETESKKATNKTTERKLNCHGADLCSQNVFIHENVNRHLWAITDTAAHAVIRWRGIAFADTKMLNKDEELPG